MTMTLDSLLQDLEKQAMEKVAADETKTEDEKKKEEEARKSEEGKTGEEKKEKEQEKKAGDSSDALAQQIMQKVASANFTEETNEMQKQAAAAGKTLAEALLIKLANAGDQITVDGIPAGVVPNKNQIDNAQMEAEHAAIVKPMLTGNGIKNEGTINQIFDAIVQDAVAQGGVTTTEMQAGQTAGKDGAVEAHATPNQVPDVSVEKTAAVIELVNQGIDFDSAVDLVKSAAYELEFEEGEQIKQAAMNELMAEGVDFDSAVELIKSAGMPSALASGIARAAKAQSTRPAYLANAVGSAVGAAKSGAGAVTESARNAAIVARNRLMSVPGAIADYAGKVGSGAKAIPHQLQGLNTAYKLRGTGSANTVGGALSRLAGNPAVQLAGGAAGVAGLGAGGYALAHQKQAAVGSLIEAGVDFDSAVALVQDKSQELYGA